MDVTSYLLGKKSGGGGPTPTGTINITENGTHDVTNYASANVNVSGSDKVDTFTKLNAKVKEFYDYLVEEATKNPASTSENVTLYTPNADYKSYVIYKYKSSGPSNYVIIWTKTSNGYCVKNDLTFNSLYLRPFYFRIVISGDTDMRLWGTGTDDYHKIIPYNSTAGWYVSTGMTLEQCLEAIKDDATAYTYSTSSQGIVIDTPYDIAYSNTFAFKYPEEELATTQKISSNETIQVIE